MNYHTIMVIWKFLRKLKIELPCDPAIPLLGIYPKKTIIPKIYIHLNVHCSTIYNSQGIEPNFSSAQPLSRVRLWPHGLQHTIAIANSQSLLKLMSIESVIPFNHCIHCHPLLLLPSIFPNIRVFSNESALHIRWPKYWSFSFNTSDLISPSNEYSGLISFRMDWLDPFAVQRTLESLLQHHSSKASILWHSAFFIVQLSHPYMTTGETTALIRWTFASKVMCLLFNMLSKLVIVFLTRSKCLLISWLQSPSAVILEPLQNKISHCFHCFSIYLPWSYGTRCHDLSFLNAF